MSDMANMSTPSGDAEKSGIPLRVDPDRLRLGYFTGILVRALDTTGQWCNADIVEIDTNSLTRWLRSRGGDNPWAESVVRSLLGHPAGGGEPDA